MSKIEWTDKTINPIVGCTKVSEACKNCYAEKLAFRHKKNYQKTHNLSLEKYSYVVGDDGKWNNATCFDFDTLFRSKLGKKGNKVFIGSMTDLFHESVSDVDLDTIMVFIGLNKDYIFQICTKRPYRMKHYLEEYYTMTGIKPLENLWIGVTVENQEMANKRIPDLLETPASVRFISVEPMLGMVDLTNLSGPGNCYYQVLEPIENCGDSNRPALDWVICGPETGPKARPMKKEWIESLYLQCRESCTPFFDKKDILKLNLKQFPDENSL